MKRRTVLVLLALCAISLSACEREARRFRQPAAAASTPPEERVTQLEQDAKSAKRERAGPYDANAYDVAQGKRLYIWFNCVGCHGMGGGGMGPPLMDDKWLYGHKPQDVFASIVEGRANGMPSFSGRISEQQVWQLVAYVRSMSGLIPDDALPGRADSLSAVEPELRRDALTPKAAKADAPKVR
jgi:cytochrome c oxidase cbb3-type subunit III